MADALDARVSAALARIQNPRLENDLLSAGMIRDLAVADDGRVSFTFLLAPDDPATLVREARAAVRAVDGVTEVKINVTNPAGPARATHGPPGAEPAARHTLPPASNSAWAGCSRFHRARAAWARAPFRRIWRWRSRRQVIASA